MKRSAIPLEGRPEIYGQVLFKQVSSDGPIQRMILVMEEKKGGDVGQITACYWSEWDQSCCKASDKQTAAKNPVRIFFKNLQIT